jgi:stage II sporulation protein M
MATEKKETSTLKRILFGNYTEYAAKLAPIFALCCFLFGFSLGMGYLLGDSMPSSSMNDILDSFPDLTNMSLLELFAFIAANNVFKSLLFMGAGILGGILPLFFVIFNGFFIGWVAYNYSTLFGVGYILTGLIPHGIIEIPMIILAMSMGMSLGYTLLNQLRGEGNVMDEIKTVLGLFITRIAPLLIVAAVIEVTITPLIMLLFGYA